jgi:hypothetical protein
MRTGPDENDRIFDGFTRGLPAAAGMQATSPAGGDKEEA